MDKEIFVQNVKNKCKALGFKPTVACRESGVGASYLSDIKRGRVPSIASVQALATYLGTTTSELLGEKENSSAAAPGDKTAPSPEDWARAFSELSTDKLMEVQEIMLKEFGIRIKGGSSDQ